MKNIIAYFIKFPVAVNILMLTFIVFGFFGAKNMLSSFFPLTESELVQINIVYPGASPAEIEEGVVLKIEKNLKGIIGIDRVTSVSNENSAQIKVEIARGEQIDFVLSDIKNAVDRVPSFPTGMEPPIISIIESVRPTISFTVSGKHTTLLELKEYARSIESDLRALDGISQLTITGFPAEEISISVNETRLRAYDLTFQNIANAVSQSNILTTGGNIKTEEEEYLIRASNKHYQAQELENIPVKADVNGGIIRLKDIAKVEDTWSETPDRIFFNGEKAVNISISNTNDEDLLSTADKVKAYIQDYNEKQDIVYLNIASDASVTLSQRTKLLIENAAVGVLLVLVFLALFLNARLAIWVAAGLPIAFMGMFIFAAQLGITINVLSLFGMIIVIGILVDDGIVIGENIYHHYEKGKSPVRAAIDGTLEVIPPVISALMTTVIAFSTFFFLDGRIGKFFGEVAQVVTLTLAVSLVEALIILPAHIAHSKALQKNKTHSKFDLFFIRINEKANLFLIFLREKAYLPVFKFSLKNPFLALAIPISILILSFGAIKGGLVGTSFFPRIASDRISVSLKMPQGTSETITYSIITSIENTIWNVNTDLNKDQHGDESVIQNIVKRIGPGTSNGSLTINLLPGESRDQSSLSITNRFRKAVGEIESAESLSFGSNSNFGGSPISISLLGNNISELKEAVSKLKEVLKNHPDLKDVTDNDPDGIKEIQIVLKDKAYLLGLNLQAVMNQVRSGFFGFQAQRFQRGEDEIKVWVRYSKEDRSSLNHLNSMWISTPGGGKVPFSEIGTYAIKRGEISINHLKGKREIQVNADLKSKEASASNILTAIKKNELQDILDTYKSLSVSYEGQNREAQKTLSSVQSVAPIILLLIYLVIAFTFRSYSQPILLLLLIPFSLIGVVWGHFLHGFQINILSWLGIIALIGIMVNDGLVFIGKFNSYLKEGHEFDEALIQAGKSRFRAIFLTSLTTVAGLAPLMLETSRQAQFLIPMAISISYGITVATVLTLIILPLFLSISNRVKVFVKWLMTGNEISREEVERAIIESKHQENDEA